MVRPSSPLLLSTILLLGVLIGLNLAPWRKIVSAQARPAASPIEDLAPAPSSISASPRGQGEEAIYSQLARQYARFEQVDRTFELVAKAVSPSVVHLVAHKVGRREEGQHSGEYEETGSGIIVRGDGAKGLFVLTNNHVVANAAATQIDIFLNDGRSFHPTRIWLDSKADVAVLKLDRSDLPAARLGNSDDAAVGSWVMAMGSPFGLSHSVSQGIISGRGRHEDDLERSGVENQDFLQTDAAINPGNSGGALVDGRGRLIGINSAIATLGGGGTGTGTQSGSIGVGFAIPVDEARSIAEQLIRTGKATHPAIGVNAMTVGADGNGQRGAQLVEVVSGGAAQQAGLQAKDIITKLDGKPVQSVDQLIVTLRGFKVGDSITVSYVRGSDTRTAKLVLQDKKTG